MNTSKKRAFITGAGGFVGANLVHYLIKRNYEIHILLKKDIDYWRLKEVKKRVVVHFTQLNESKKLKKLLAEINPSHIFHLATSGSYPTQNDVEKMINTNIIGTFNLLEASRSINYKIFINTGSSSEYGYKTKPMKENNLLEPASYYAATKSSATLIAQTFAKIYKKPVITFRLFSVYGPYEERSRFIPTAVNAAIYNKILNLTGSKTMHDFIYIDDVIRAYEMTGQKDISPGEIFNIGSGKQYSNLEIAKTVKKLINPKLKISIGTYKPRSWDTNYWVSNNQKAKKILGWSPKYDISEGLIKTAGWLKQNNYYETN